ncbi:MAG: hypothetical protein EOO15_24820 [Chitinophagaceae bacterium]|nr:MAG: hypothetical protein EOO15_24820 [Chitinophagaceae bacterium]
MTRPTCRNLGQTRISTLHERHGCLYLKHVFVEIRASGVKVALLDFEKSRKRFTAMKASRHDLRQVKRRSN